MDQTLIIAVVVVAAIIAAIVYFTVLKKPAPQQLEGKDEEPKELPEAGKKPNLLAEKLKERREEQAGAKVEKPVAKPAEAPVEKAAPKAEPSSTSEAPRPAEKLEPVRVEKAESKPAPVEEPAVEAPKPAAEAPKPVVEAPVAAKAAVPSAGRPAISHKRDVEGVRQGMSKARGSEGFFGRLSALVSGRKLDPELVDELESVLLTSDVGQATTSKIIERVRTGLAKHELSDPQRVWEALRSEAGKILAVGGGGIVLRGEPTVVMMVGVNGAGKTTTIGKIATKLTSNDRKVVLAAGDTFRAAAVQQLEVWGKRVGCEVVKGKEGADPAGVAFDAVSKGKSLQADVVLCDTAGRLGTKVPLMDELKKIAKSISKAADGAPHETLLVIDATNGQNAINQVQQFSEALPLTGIILTKLDGTAKGGVILRICDEFKVPIRYIGLGERSDDLHEFDAEEYVEAVFGDFGRGSEAA